MAKPKLKGMDNAPVNNFAMGKISLVNSAQLGHMVYSGKIAIPRVIPETRIRIVPVPMQRSESSPDYNVECVEVGPDGKPYWAAGAGVAWWREKNDTTRIDLLLNIGQGQTSVNATLWPADEQPDEQEWPEAYDGECGPIDWRVSYSPPRPAGGKPRTSPAPAAQLQDEIPY